MELYMVPIGQHVRNQGFPSSFVVWC